MAHQVSLSRILFMNTGLPPQHPRMRILQLKNIKNKKKLTDESLKLLLSELRTAINQMEAYPSSHPEAHYMSAGKHLFLIPSKIAP